MSMANVAADHTGPEEHWEPALTWREAATALRISKDEYESAALFAHMVVEEHLRSSTPTARDRWEPTPNLNDNLAAPFIADGEDELTSRLKKEADPPLDEAQGLIENVKTDLDEIAEDTRPIVSREAGSSYSVTEAVKRVREHDIKIERDEANGQHYHGRVGVLLQQAVTWTPSLETAGFLTFVTYYLNVPLFQPWQDWLGWSFAVTVVVGIIVGQTWLVRYAGKSHNYAREAAANNHRQEAARGFTRRNRYIGLTAVTAFAITSGMIWRGTAALGNASIGTTGIMIFLAAVTGLLLPTLAYLGIALDGSAVSRERDGLTADLDDELGEYLEAIASSRRDLASAVEIGDTLRDKTFPDVCNTTQEAVDAVYGFYSLVRLLIGGLSADPPSRTGKTIDYNGAGKIGGYIGTSIPGAGTVNLGPLFDRQHRLEEIEAQRTSLLHQINALPPHPWGTPRTA